MEYGYLRPINGGPTCVLVAPTHCANRHPLGPRRVLVGTARCHCGRSRTGAHTTWQCRTCGHIAYADGHVDDSRLAETPPALPEAARIG